jgi:hypothetical protein
MLAKRKPLSSTALSEIQSALVEYCSAVLAADISQRTQSMYIDGANNFVRWLRGAFEPGRPEHLLYKRPAGKVTSIDAGKRGNGA